MTRRVIVLTGDTEHTAAHVEGADTAHIGDYVVGPEPVLLPAEVLAELGKARAQVDDRR